MARGTRPAALRRRSSAARALKKGTRRNSSSPPDTPNIERAMNVSELVGTASGRRRFLLWIKLVVVASLLSVSGAYLYHNRNIFAARAQEFVFRARRAPIVQDRHPVDLVSPSATLPLLPSSTDLPATSAKVPLSIEAPKSAYFATTAPAASGNQLTIQTPPPRVPVSEVPIRTVVSNSTERESSLAHLHKRGHGNLCIGSDRFKYAVFSGSSSPSSTLTMFASTERQKSSWDDFAREDAPNWKGDIEGYLNNCANDRRCSGVYCQQDWWDSGGGTGIYDHVRLTCYTYADDFFRNDVSTECDYWTRFFVWNYRVICDQFASQTDQNVEGGMNCGDVRMTKATTSNGRSICGTRNDVYSSTICGCSLSTSYIKTACDAQSVTKSFTTVPCGSTPTPTGFSIDTLPNLDPSPTLDQNRLWSIAPTMSAVAGCGDSKNFCQGTSCNCKNYPADWTGTGEENTSWKCVANRPPKLSFDRTVHQCSVNWTQPDQFQLTATWKVQIHDTLFYDYYKLGRIVDPNLLTDKQLAESQIKDRNLFPYVENFTILVDNKQATPKRFTFTESGNSGLECPRSDFNGNCQLDLLVNITQNSGLSPNPSIPYDDLFYYFTVSVTSPRAGSLLSQIMLDCSAIKHRPPRPFLVDAPAVGGTGIGSVTKYFGKLPTTARFKVSLDPKETKDPYVATVRISLHCSGADPISNTDTITNQLQQPYEYDFQMPENLTETLCHAEVTLENDQKDWTSQETYFGVLTLPPTVSNVVVDVDESGAEYVQTTATAPLYQTDTKARRSRWNNTYWSTSFNDYIKAYPNTTIKNGIVKYDVKQNFTLLVAKHVNSSVAKNVSDMDFFASCIDNPQSRNLDIDNDTYFALSCNVHNTTLDGMKTEITDNNPSQLMKNCTLLAKDYYCVGCIKCHFSTIVKGYNEANLSTETSTRGVFLDAEDPKIDPWMDVPGKSISRGHWWYSDARHIALNTRMSEPQSTVLAINARLAVAGYMQQDTNKIGATFTVYNVDKGDPTANLDTTTGAVSLKAQQYTGNPTYHNQLYNLTLTAYTDSGRSASRSGFFMIDTTPPRIGSVQWQSLALPRDDNTPWVAFSGFHDGESGIKEYQYRVGPDHSFCDGAGFGTELWTTVKGLVPDHFGDPGPVQEVSVTLPNEARNWNHVVYAIAAVNYAYTPGKGDISKSVSFKCTLPLPIDRSVPLLYISDIHLRDADEIVITDNSSTRQFISASYFAEDKESGISHYSVEVFVDGKLEHSISPYFGTIGTFPIEERIAAGSNFSVCISATNWANATIDPQCTTKTVETYPNLSNCATIGTQNYVKNVKLEAHWGECIMGNIGNDIDHYAVSILRSPNNTEEVAVRLPKTQTDLFIDVPEDWQAGFWVNVGATDANGHILQTYATPPIFIDFTAPVPVSGIIRHLDTSTSTPISITANADALLIGWDAFEDFESGVSSYNVSLFDGGTGQLLIGPHNIAETETNYLFSTLTLRPGDIYLGEVLAINTVGLASDPIRSMGISVVDSTTDTSPFIKIHGGERYERDNGSYVLFRNPSFRPLHISWGAFKTNEMAWIPNYEVVLLNESEHVLCYTSSVHIMLDPPPPFGEYKMKIQATSPSGNKIAAVSNETLIISEDTQIATPDSGNCTVTRSLSLDGVEAYEINATWVSFRDPLNLLSKVQIGFRRTDESEHLSAWVTVPLNETWISTAVPYSYGYALLETAGFECVLQGIDFLGGTHDFSMNVTSPMERQVMQPTVLDLSTWALEVKPTSSADWQYFNEVRITSNTTLAAAFFAFPPLMVDGVPAATVNYSIGDMKNIRGYYDNIVPSTPMDFIHMIAYNHTVFLDNQAWPVTVFQPELLNGVLEGTTLHVCVYVTQISDNSTVAACSNGVTFDLTPPTPGTVTLGGGDSSFITSSSSLRVAWSDFTDEGMPDSITNDTVAGESNGIAFYFWGIGSYPGLDDIIPMTYVDGEQRLGVGTDLWVENGAVLYAAVQAFDHAGLSTTVVSRAYYLDTTPPLSEGIQLVTSLLNSDGTSSVRLLFDAFEDMESGIKDVVWIIESAYGLEDILPPRHTNMMNYAFISNITLAAGVEYVCRVVAVNEAGLRSEYSTTFVSGNKVEVVYIVDGRNASAPLHVTPNNTKYELSWRFTGNPTDYLVAVGTQPGQSDVFDFASYKADTTSLSIELDPVTDGMTLYGTVYAQNIATKRMAIVFTKGLLYDTSPPVPGRVAQGRSYIHSVFTSRAYSVTGSWMNFLDPHSGIVRYEYCVGSTPGITEADCDMLSWRRVFGQHNRVVDAALPAGKSLAQNGTYYFKVKATNGVNLTTIERSPPFIVDMTPPKGGTVRISHPSGDDSLFPIYNGTQYYLDRSTMKVSWDGFYDSESGIASYEVALYQNCGKQIRDFVSTSSQTSYIFTDLELNSTLGLNDYFAVVRGRNGAGQYAEVSSSTVILTSDPPTAGEVLVDCNANSLAIQVGGFDGGSAPIVRYSVLVGSVPYANDTGTTCDLKVPCEPCECNVKNLQGPDGSTYHVSVIAINGAGLSTSPAIGSATCTSSGLTQSAGFAWNLTTARPWAVNLESKSQSTIVLSGYGLSNFFASSASPTFTCLFNSSTITLDDSLRSPTAVLEGMNDPNTANIPVVKCPAPYNLSVRSQDTTLTVRLQAPDTTKSNMLVIPHRSGPAGDWSNAAPRVAHVVGDKADVHISRSLFNLSWSVDTLQQPSYFKIRHSEASGSIFTAAGHQSTALLSLPESVKGSSITFRVCAVYPTSPETERCLSTKEVILAESAPLISDEVSKYYELELPTTVRVIGVGSNTTYKYEAAQFQNHVDNITAEWADSFIPGSTKIVGYEIVAGYASNSSYAPLGTVTVDSSKTNATFKGTILPGVPYYVTVAAQDAAGLVNVQSSAPITADITPPVKGIVKVGRVTSVHDVKWQANTSVVDTYWRGFADPESGARRFQYALCTPSTQSPDGMNCAGWKVANYTAKAQITDLTLTTNVDYHIGVTAENGAGLWSQVSYSPVFRVDPDPPGFPESVRWMNKGEEVEYLPVNMADFQLTWKASALSPIESYYVMLGTTKGGAQLLTRTHLSTLTSFRLTDIHFTHDTQVWATVWAKSVSCPDEAVASSGPIKVDRTPPAIQSSVIVSDGAHFVPDSGVVSVKADWTDVFVDLESGIESYMWAVGTYSNTTQFSGDWLPALLNTTASTEAAIYNGSRVIVSVKAINRAGLASTALSSEVIYSTAAPPPFTIRIIDDLNRVIESQFENAIYLANNVVKFRWDDLVDHFVGIKDISVRLNETADVLIEWTSVDTSAGVELEIEDEWLGKTLQLVVSATNNVGLATMATSKPFMVDSTPPLPGTVDLSWRNNILDISITNFTDPELPHTNIRYTIGAFDSDSISTFNIKQPASGYWTTPNESVLKTSILVSDPDPGKNYTVITRAQNSVGLTTTVVSVIPGKDSLAEMEGF